MDKKITYLANLGLLMVAMIWGGGFVATKNALEEITPLYLMAMRFTIAFLILAVMFYKKIKNTNRQELIGGVVIGLFLYFAFASQTIGLQFTTPGKQAFLTGTNVVMVPFLYWAVYKKRPDIYSFVGAFLCFIGIAALTYNKGMAINFGDLLTLICAVLFAGHIVSTGFYAQKFEPINLTIIQFGVAAVLSMITAFLMEPSLKVISYKGYLSVLYLSVLSTCLAFLLQTVAQKYTKSTSAAIFLSMEAVFGSIFSVIFTGEVFTLKMILGCVLIFISVIVVETKLEFLKSPC
ncbi:Threonine/homoserine efflux transporter RhtA [Caloramator fervidus]|uniref:Threonine/homoserine efflux transporter RhtA n=1 Tax=Caloramator fervidus TaxID=29344 RepID=A0A1H5WQW5_9CLOT|nr:DMT family transporter [Caloramator fervidus]SEG01703.1 Threonine/homoserine efflux transporter RhtA [Caloramator fervidus]